MIKFLDTHVAVIAVSGSWRSVNIASVTELNFQWVSFDGCSIEDRLIFADGAINIFITDRDSPKLFKFIIAKYFRDDARISKGEDDHKKDSEGLKNSSKKNKIPIF